MERSAPLIRPLFAKLPIILLGLICVEWVMKPEVIYQWREMATYVVASLLLRRAKLTRRKSLKETEDSSMYPKFLLKNTVPPSIDDIKIVQVKNSFNKDDEDHISTVLHSQYEGYFSRNSDYTKSEDITAIHDNSLNNKEELEEE